MNSQNTQYEEIYNRGKTFLPIIEKVYQGNNHDIVEAGLLGDLLKLLADLPPDFHMFCDPVLEPISIFCLTIFSFNEADTTTWIKNKFNPVLSKCEKCILSFTRGKSKMLQHFAIQRHIPHEHIAKFNNIVSLWRIESISPTLKNISSSDDKATIDISTSVRCAIFEGLCNPHMLRLSQDFKNLFNIIFKYLYDTKYVLLDTKSPESLQTYVAGSIYCWCEGTQEQINWSKAFLTKLHHQKLRLTKTALTPDILEEMSFHILFLQNPANWTDFVISQFWARLLPIFGFLEADALEEYFIIPKDIDSLQKSFKFSFESIFMLWYKHLSKASQDKPLDFLLRALNLFLEKLDDKFWEKIEPYTFHNILDIIFEKNTFLTKLSKIQNNRIPNDDVETFFSLEGSMTDLLSWTLPFYHSLSYSKRIQMVKKVSMSFLRIISAFPTLKPIPKACLMNSSTALLRAVLTINDEERSGLYVREDFQTVLFTKSDSRSLLNNPLTQDIVIKSATHAFEIYPGLGQASLSVSRSAMMVLTKCIDLDILLLCQRTYRLYSGKTVSDLPIPLTLLENLNKNMQLASFEDGPLLAKYLLISFRNINGLLPIRGDSPAIKKHNETVKKFLELGTDLIGKFTDILPDKLSEILSDANASEGFWSCIFSSDAQLYQVATNILYDTFDVEGRLEGIQAILHNNLNNQMKSINIVLGQLIRCEFFEPCPRAIRVLMDILSAFSDPISGIISNYVRLKNENTDKEIVLFWQLSWEFLDTIYRCTLNWASKYEYSELENFTKDTLELSRSFVDSFREFSDVITISGVDLFETVLKAFKNMLYWLRLSDDELLESCVRLIISTTDLAYERKMNFDDGLVESMAKYASKAKKYSNKLTEKQNREILGKASLFNYKLVDQVVESVERARKEKESLKQQTLVGNTNRLSTLGDSKVDFLQRKATSSSILGRPKSAQPKITSFGVFKPGNEMNIHAKKVSKPLSRMELARKQLMSNRVVHPASNAVFHTKTKAHIKNEDSSSGESEAEGDIESARELFAISKAKNQSIETLDINGKKINRNTKAELAKLKEEYMRRRLNVDLNPLYETILQWDYTRKSEYPDDQNQTYTDIKDTFSSTAEYGAVVEPLLLLECWQGLCASRDRIDNIPFSIIVGNRTAISDFYEVYTSMPKSFIENSKIMESDLVALAYFPNLSQGQRLSSNDFRTAENSCLAKIRSINYTKNNNVDLTLRIHRDHKFSKYLTLRSEIYAIKVMQMTTVEREFQSLNALEYYDLVDQILSAKPSPPVNISSQEVEKIRKNYNLNTSQAEAIIHTVTNEGFSLIQGPPGTGKTKTILGIIGYFLSTINSLPSNIIKLPEQSKMTTEQLLKKQKVLICAPSNAAVDELCIRLKKGVYDKNGVLFRPKVVRVGRSDVVNVAIKDLTLEELVDRRVAAKNYEFNQNPELEAKFSSAVTKRRKLRDKLNTENGSPESTLSVDDIKKLQADIRELSKELNVLGKERDELREKNSLNYRKRDLDKRNAQLHVLADSDIICSTLSGAAHDVLATLGINFDTVIIDEACQCTELSSIIPLRYGCKRCILVGDPNQLPPTVLSGAASNFKYNQSLFVRMEKNTTPYLLDVQYRMHPDISRFPSREFYNGRLQDGPNMDIINKRPWHACTPLQPYKFFDISTGRQEQNTKTMSYVNLEEIQVAMDLVSFLFKKYEKEADFTGKIGIISPYREQMQRMRRKFTSFFGSFIEKYIDFNTIDGFQGQEKEIIIISCVRADDTKTSVGFLKDFRRMNVAFTRAKTSLWILGHRNSLYNNKLWRNLIDDAESRHCLQKAYAGFLSNIGNSNNSILAHEENDAYNPLEVVSSTSRKRQIDNNIAIAEPDHKRPRDRLSKKKKREKNDKKDKRDKKDKKDKRDKKDKKDKENGKKRKEKVQDIENSGEKGPSLGTKKKSSIFGAPPTSIPKSVPVPNSGIYINDEKRRTERKLITEKTKKLLSFSDDITTIADGQWKKLAPSKSLDPPLKSATKYASSKKSEENTKHKSFSNSEHKSSTKSGKLSIDHKNTSQKNDLSSNPEPISEIEGLKQSSNISKTGEVPSPGLTKVPVISEHPDKVSRDDTFDPSAISGCSNETVERNDINDNRLTINVQSGDLKTPVVANTSTKGIIASSVEINITSNHSNKNKEIESKSTGNEVITDPVDRSMQTRDSNDKTAERNDGYDPEYRGSERSEPARTYSPYEPDTRHTSRYNGNNTSTDIHFEPHNNQVNKPQPTDLRQGDPYYPSEQFQSNPVKELHISRSPSPDTSKSRPNVPSRSGRRNTSSVPFIPKKKRPFK